MLAAGLGLGLVAGLSLASPVGSEGLLTGFDALSGVSHARAPGESAGFTILFHCFLYFGGVIKKHRLVCCFFVYYIYIYIYVCCFYICFLKTISTLSKGLRKHKIKIILSVRCCFVFFKFVLMISLLCGGRKRTSD